MSTEPLHLIPHNTGFDFSKVASCQHCKGHGDFYSIAGPVFCTHCEAEKQYNLLVAYYRDVAKISAIAGSIKNVHLRTNLILFQGHASRAVGYKEVPTHFITSAQLKAYEGT